MIRKKIISHQYIDRETGFVKDEILYHDSLINCIYSSARENSSFLYRMVTSARMTAVLAYINYDMPMGKGLSGGKSFLDESGIDFSEFLDLPETLDTSRKFFERKIRFSECRPMAEKVETVISPADSRMLIGSLHESSFIFLKEKFFKFQELLGDRAEWCEKFRDGKYAVFRLTPDKYHYNHVPVSGNVADYYEIDGVYNSCNPGAVSAIDGAYSKNRRSVTVIDTDVHGGSGVGLVAMVEVVALMIGVIQQCYSENGYEKASEIKKGMFLKRGAVKSLFRPGSSVDILLFERGRIVFSDDLVENSQRRDVSSRFSVNFERPLVETDVKVRSEIAQKK